MSKVSRSVYQKLAEENKRLLRDIEIMCSGSVSLEKIRMIKKWRNKFKKDQEFRNLLKEYAVKYFKDHPEMRVSNQPSLVP